MENDIYKTIAEDISQINKNIKDSRDRIGFLKDAGESTVELESELRNLEIRKNKWERALKNRGIIIPD